MKETLVNARNDNKKERNTHLSFRLSCSCFIERRGVSSRFGVVWLAMGEIYPPEIQANSIYHYLPHGAPPENT